MRINKFTVIVTDLTDNTFDIRAIVGSIEKGKALIETEVGSTLTWEDLWGGSETRKGQLRYEIRPVAEELG